MQRMRQNTTIATTVLMGLAAVFAGCGGGSQAAPAAPAPQNATVNGQYNLVLTSTNGHGTTNIYTRFTETGTSFMGAGNTLLCPSNEVSQCQGQDASGISITPTGTVSGADVRMVISVATTSAVDTVSMTGTATETNLAGTYTDSLGDTGTWIASVAGSLSGTYSGTFNSTSNPLPIPPTILMTLAQDAGFHLTGTAMIMSSPCISSLSLSGDAIGGAFSLTDAMSKAHIVALPNESGFTFSYNFDTTAPSCALDSGRGVLTTKPSPWDY